MQSSRTVIGLDIAKRVFQLHWVDMETGELMNLRLTRAKLLEPFGNRAPCLVGMEACGGSQHWARRLQSLGHEVRLLPAKMVRPFVSGNKNDARDAQAIWAAVQQPGVKTVAVKSEEQQGILALHRMRQQLVKFRYRPDSTARPSRDAAGTWLRPSSGSRSGCRQWSSRRWRDQCWRARGSDGYDQLVIPRTSRRSSTRKSGGNVESSAMRAAFHNNAVVFPVSQHRDLRCTPFRLAAPARSVGVTRQLFWEEFSAAIWTATATRSSASTPVKLGAVSNSRQHYLY